MPSPSEARGRMLVDAHTMQLASGEYSNPSMIGEVGPCFVAVSVDNKSCWHICSHRRGARGIQFLCVHLREFDKGY